MTTLPWHWPAMKKVIRKHLSLFILLTFLGGTFTILGISGIIFSNELPTKIAATCALIPGLFILGFNVVSNYSSCLHYYEQALLKKYGRSVIATVTNKLIDGIPQSSTISALNSETELGILSIQYRFSFLRQPYEGEGFVNSAMVFDAIQIGMGVPVITMKNHHHTSAKY